MPVFFQSRAGRQCVSIVGFGVTLWLLGTLLQLDDSLVSFMIGFGEYGADKLVLALGIMRRHELHLFGPAHRRSA